MMRILHAQLLLIFFPFILLFYHSIWPCFITFSNNGFFFSPRRTFMFPPSFNATIHGYTILQNHTHSNVRVRVCVCIRYFFPAALIALLLLLFFPLISLLFNYYNMARPACIHVYALASHLWKVMVTLMKMFHITNAFLSCDQFF